MIISDRAHFRLTIRPFDPRRPAQADVGASGLEPTMTYIVHRTCARVTIGIAATPPRVAMKSRRLMLVPLVQERIVSPQTAMLEGLADVPRNQKRTNCDALRMSALAPKADIRQRSRNVRFVPLADIAD